MDGILNGHRVLIPRHVQAMDRFDRRDWMQQRGILELIQGAMPSFSGAETIASMTIGGAVTGPTASPGSSMLTRECLEPIAPAYLRAAGSRFLLRAYGTTLSTAVITTQQIVLNVGPTYANPLGGQMIAQNAAWTPAAAVTADWWLDVLVTVRVTGNIGSLIAVGTCINNVVAAATYVATPFKNAAPPTAVALTTPGLLQPLFFDLISIQGAATAGNSAICMDYTLLSLN